MADPTIADITTVIAVSKAINWMLSSSIVFIEFAKKEKYKAINNPMIAPELRPVFQFEMCAHFIKI